MCCTLLSSCASYVLYKVMPQLKKVFLSVLMLIGRTIGKNIYKTLMQFVILHKVDICKLVSVYLCKLSNGVLSTMGEKQRSYYIFDQGW